MIVNTMPKPNVTPEPEAVMCLHCGAQIKKKDNAGSEKFTLCRRCFDDSYTKCVCCGTVLVRELAYRDDGGEAYCLNCFRDIRRQRPNSCSTLRNMSINLLRRKRRKHNVRSVWRSRL